MRESALSASNPKALPAMDQAIDRMSGHRSRLQGLADRLGAIRERLEGPVPRGVEKDAKPQSQSGYVNRLAELNDGIGECLNQISDDLDRLENIL
jgi:hypothetical protein